MTGREFRECPCEKEVLDLVLAERWPDRADAEIVAHAETCEVCREVVMVALAMREDEASVESAIVAGTPQHPSVVPDATLVWWRAQLRAHEDAGRRAARPVAMAQGIGIGIGLVALATVLRLSWSTFSDYLGSAGTMFGSAATRALQLSTDAVAAAPLWLTISVVAALIVAPILTYAALGRD